MIKLIILVLTLILNMSVSAAKNEEKMKEIKNVYEFIYGKNSLFIIPDQMSTFLEIEKIIGYEIPEEIKLLISINPHSEYVFLGHEPYDLKKLYKMYSNLNYKDAQLIDFTKDWKESLAGTNQLESNLRINEASEKPFVINKDSSYLKAEQGLDYDDNDFEVYYDLSFFLPIAEFEGEYLFVDLSKENYGRLLFYPQLGIDDADVLAPNLKAHLEDLITGLEDGRYNDESDIPSSWFERKNLDVQ